MSNELEYQSIGIRIRREREKWGISREKFAEMVNLSAVYIGQIERGERKMSMDTLVAISDCLKVSIDYLIYGDDNEKELNVAKEEVYSLLSGCSEKELTITSDIIKAILPHIK